MAKEDQIEMEGEIIDHASEYHVSGKARKRARCDGSHLREDAQKLHSHPDR